MGMRIRGIGDSVLPHRPPTLSMTLQPVGRQLLVVAKRVVVRVKVALEVGQQGHRAAPEKAVFTDKKLHRSPPRAGFEQAAVVPQVQRGLPHSVEGKQHQNVEIPADAPSAVAAYGLVHVKSDGFVLGFLRRVPAPQCGHLLVCPRKPRVVAQCAIGEHRCAVFKSSGYC